MTNTSNNICIIVDFDSIIKNIIATGKNHNHYKQCEDYVTYAGKNVQYGNDGRNTIITLYKNKNYFFILSAIDGNEFIPTKMCSFKDDNVILTKVENDELKLACLAVNENKEGECVTMHVEFKDLKGNQFKASWDPRLKVDIDPDSITP